MLYCLRFQTLVYAQANLLETSLFIKHPNGFAKQVFWKCVYCLGCITLYPGRNKKVAALPNQDIKLYYFFDRSKRYSIIAYEVFRAGIQKINRKLQNLFLKLNVLRACFLHFIKYQNVLWKVHSWKHRCTAIIKW